MALSTGSAIKEVVAADLPLAISNLNDVKQQATQVNQMVRNIIERVKNKEIPMNEGMSFLDVKNQLLLKYLTHLNFLIIKKISGESIHSDQSIDRLVEIRTILERIRPLEHKLKYQIEKLLKLSTTGKFSENDPLQFKANPHNFVPKVDDDSSSDEDGKTGKDKKSGVYVPPKLVAMQYDGDETALQRKSKAEEKIKRHNLSVGAIQGLREEYLDTPAEIVESMANGGKSSVARERQERQEYEETYFTRLPYTRQDRHKSRQQYSSAAFADELAGIGPSGKSGSKRKGGNKKGGFKRKRKH